MTTPSDEAAKHYGLVRSSLPAHTETPSPSRHPDADGSPPSSAGVRDLQRSPPGRHGSPRNRLRRRVRRTLAARLRDQALQLQGDGDASELRIAALAPALGLLDDMLDDVEEWDEQNREEHDLDLVYGLGRLTTAAEPRRLFERIARALRPGGRLALFDPFLEPSIRSDRLGNDELDWLRELARRPGTGALLTPAQADWLAERAGFEPTDDSDFSAEAGLGSARDRALSAVVATLRPFARQAVEQSSWFRRWKAHHAMRRLLQRGLVQPRLRVWRLSR